MRKKNKRFFSMLMAGTMALSFLTATGCSKEEPRKVAVIPMSTSADYWKTLEKGARDACDELGIEMTFEGPNDETDIDSQIQYVEKAINNKVDAIVISPCDYELVSAVLDKAGNSGIKVVTVNSDASSDAVLSNVATDNDSSGAIVAREAMKYANKDNSVIAMGHLQGNVVCEARIAEFVTTIQDANTETAPKLLDTVYCQNDIDDAKKTALNLINSHPELSVIYTTNELSTIGACQAVEEKGLKDKVSIIGFDSSEKEISYLRSGILKAFIAQSPYNMGYLGVRYADKAIDDDTLPYYVDTGAFLVTPDNIDEQTTQLILYPDKF